MIEQNVRPDRVNDALIKYKIPQRTVAELANFSQPALSMFLSGHRGLTLDSQIALLKALRWLRELAQAFNDYATGKGAMPLPMMTSLSVMILDPCFHGAA